MTLKKVETQSSPRKSYLEDNFTAFCKATLVKIKADEGPCENVWDTLYLKVERKDLQTTVNSACAFATFFISFKVNNRRVTADQTKQLKHKTCLYNVVKLRCHW